MVKTEKIHMVVEGVMVLVTEEENWVGRNRQHLKQHQQGVTEKRNGVENIIS